MNRKILTTVLSLFCLTCFAQSDKVDMRSLLRTMPDDVFPLLTHNNILDFIDFLASDMKAEVDNRLGGKSEMTMLCDSACHIRLTSVSEADVRLVSADGKQSVEVTHVYHAGETKSSSTTVYTLDWNKPNK
ncbi:MAG: DUF3256 family protein [Bacteroidaceae bacterium]|nr:DUF3256 family protein [Bacteroidaceae bacterium]